MHGMDNKEKKLFVCRFASIKKPQNNIEIIIGEEGII